MFPKATSLLIELDPMGSVFRMGRTQVPAHAQRPLIIRRRVGQPAKIEVLFAEIVEVIAELDLIQIGVSGPVDRNLALLDGTREAGHRLVVPASVVMNDTEVVDAQAQRAVKTRQIGLRPHQVFQDGHRLLTRL